MSGPLSQGSKKIRRMADKLRERERKREREKERKREREEGS